MSRISNRQRQRTGSASSAAVAATDKSNVAQLMGEVAAELRAPLTTVRASVELLQEGQLGQLSARQSKLLSNIADHCGDIDRMIGKLASNNRQSAAAPPVVRRPVVVSEIRSAVDQVLVNDGIPHAIDVLWDGADDPNLQVFADPELICEVLVHLVGMSVKVTPQGGCVLIRLQTTPAADSVRWSVIDQGPGTTVDDVERLLSRINEQSKQFGLADCRQIATLHFSNLDLYSRVGSGTEISFDTPKSGPRSVVGVWSAWRSLHQPKAPDDDGQSRTDQRFRIDSTPGQILPPAPEHVPHCMEQLTAGTVTVGAAVSKNSADAFDRFLQQQLTGFDLVYRVGTRRWVWAFDNTPGSARQRIAGLSAQATSVISGLRMNWSEPMSIPVEPRQLNLRLGELMVRQSLSESTVTGVVDKDTVRMGTAPLAPSPLTNVRLDEELRRLSGQLKMQTQRLQRQARQLRPRG